MNIPTAELEAFAGEDEKQPKTVLYPRNPDLDPQLVWKGKDEQDQHPLEVPSVPIYIQEHISPKALIEDLRATSAGRREQQLDLFGDFNGMEFGERVEFYQHPMKWTNRMILGDSLLVMTSLAEKEGLKGQVQMIYVDPPYGIKFGSNWQVSTRKRDVRDGRLDDATRQPEQVKAYRDTWELGIHSYLSYLRDRFVVARDLLTDSGSIFVQIGDENVHLVRSLLDEAFGRENFVSLITFVKTSSASAERLAGISDVLLWYARRRDDLKYHQLYFRKDLGGPGSGQYSWIEEPDGSRRRATSDELASVQPGHRYLRADQLTSQRPAQGTDVRSFELDGREFTPGRGTFKTDRAGLEKLRTARRLMPIGNTLTYVRYLDDFPAFPLVNLWTDTVSSGFADPRVYVVQTHPTVLERCILLTTDPGDLVLDPTFGSATTGVAAEQSGRRWIGIDTSRVAISLARTRLMSARYSYYLLADSPEGLRKEAELTGRAAPPIQTGYDMRKGFVYERVRHVTLKSIVQNPDIREGMTREEIDAAIARNAASEILFDRPYTDPKVVRVAGPFTVESLSPHRMIVDGDEGGDGGVYDPTTGEFRSDSPDEIASWFIDTDYNGESFFVRHAYFCGGDRPYERLQKTLRAEIDEAAWESLYSATSRPFPKPRSGKIAVKVINHYGDEILRVYEV